MRVDDWSGAPIEDDPDEQFEFEGVDTVDADEFMRWLQDGEDDQKEEEFLIDEIFPVSQNQI